MGLFEAIRSRSGLVVSVIGISLIAFVLTDFLSSGNVLFQGDKDAVGRIGGTKISYIEFNKDVEELRQNPQYAQASPLQISELVWNNLLNEKLLVEPMADLGFVVTDEELRRVIELNPSVQQMPGLQDPNTGAFRPDLLRSALQNLRDQREQSSEAAAQYESWVAFESDIKNQSLSNKIYDAVSAGMRMPLALQNALNARNNRQIQLEVASMSVSEVADSSVEATDADYKAVYAEYKSSFKLTKPVRDGFVADFPLAPSDEDLVKVKLELSTLAADFAASSDDSSFAAANSDVFATPSLRPESSINPIVLEAIQGMTAGFVGGPIQDGDSYRLVKVMSRAALPDSARAKHILIAYAGSERSSAQRSYQEAKELADSLLAAIKSGASFAAASEALSSDVVAASKGGDLGWFQPGMMTPAFEQFCFERRTGSFDLVETEFGFHLVEVTGQKGSRPALRLAEIVRRIDVSPETEQKIYAQASALAKAIQEGKEPQEAAAQLGVAMLPARNVTATDASVMGLTDGREVVRWMFNEDREVGEVSVVNNNYKSYSVVYVSGAFEEGYKPLDAVKDDLNALALNRAKVRALAERMSKTEQLNWTPANVTLASPFLVSGREPKVVGIAAGSKVGAESEVIEGSNGVYRFKVVNTFDAAPSLTAADMAAENNRLAGNAQRMLLQSLLGSAKVTDNRGMFY
ncbi:MAG: peptidylprolyl isomerase [Schleiferiaceae bacterium]|nr:peptidylprolyl isomerase [Schleiferiaceae bacterium]